MSKIGMMTMAIRTARPENVDQRVLDLIAHVAAGEAQRDAAVATLKELYALAIGVNNLAIMDKWQSDELRSALRKAKDAIDATHKGIYPGRIVIYPQIEMPLTSVDDLTPDGRWTIESEDEFLAKHLK